MNGTEIGLIILGEDKNAPVLMVCGGGPGIPEYLLESFYPSVLPRHFVVCYFDYRGTGLSYRKADPEEMTTEQFLSDVDAITDHLRERFSADKIYIMGHSFGSYMALHAACEHPEKYEAYLAVSQVVDSRESELRAYDYMLEQYRVEGNTKMVKKFEEYPIRTDEEAYRKFCTSGLRDQAMHELGVGTTREMDSVVSGIFFPSLKCTAYTQKERIDLWKGKIGANHFAVTDDCFSSNAFEAVPALEIPVYFFVGEYDQTCDKDLQKEYFEFLTAPEKKLFSYPEAAHSPVFEDGDLTDQYLAEILGAG